MGERMRVSYPLKSWKWIHSNRSTPSLPCRKKQFHLHSNNSNNMQRATLLYTLHHSTFIRTLHLVFPLRLFQGRTTCRIPSLRTTRSICKVFSPTRNTEMRKNHSGGYNHPHVRILSPSTWWHNGLQMMSLLPWEDVVSIQENGCSSKFPRPK